MALGNKTRSVFLPWVTDDVDKTRDDLMFTLFKAGFKVFPLGPCPSSEPDFKKEVEIALKETDCSIHILGAKSGNKISGEETVSWTKYQYQRSKERLETGDTSFKIFVWHPNQQSELEDDQQDFINELENNITANMTYSNVPSTIQLTEDIRSMLTVAEKPAFNLKETDIFFINNKNDDSSALDVLDMLSDVTEIEKLSILQDSDMDYAEYSSQQISKSKLAVVYFKDSAEWALPFAQQVWKKIGGATSLTPILIIGEDPPESNRAKKISAPKIISMIVAGELVPLEIKFQFDKVTEGL